MAEKEFSLGLVVNPYAGMGGAVGLKGTDGEAVLDKAIELGAKPQSSKRAINFLESLKPARNRVKFKAPSGDMGEHCFNALKDIAYDIEIIEIKNVIQGKRTTREDTINFVKKIKNSVNLLIFVGGDGTARDVLEGIAADPRSTVPVIGVPAGVKIHSSVFGINPQNTALLVLKFLAGEIGTTEGEVMDIDEDAFRDGIVNSRLYGYLNIPYEPAFIQGTKVGSPVMASDADNKDRIANHVVRSMDLDTCYFIGPGSTTKPIFDKIGLEKTLLGVDAVCDGKLLGSDLNESGILSMIEKMKSQGKKIKLVLTVIGAQGFLFGRGNLQFSPRVIRQIGIENILVIMTRHKFTTLPGGMMRNDTRDTELDEEMRGYFRILVDDGEYKVIKLN
ncbi:MAG: ATP-NAD kinase family protein [Candidatus Hodarchaeota archaeon]